MRLRRYILSRMLQLIPVILTVIVINFLLIHLAPGDVAITLAGEDADPAYMEEIRRVYGLDKPFHEQLFRYLGQIVQGDLGISYRSREPVMAEISAPGSGNPNAGRHEFVHRPVHRYLGRRDGGSSPRLVTGFIRKYISRCSIQHSGVLAGAHAGSFLRRLPQVAADFRHVQPGRPQGGARPGPSTCSITSSFRP